MTNTYNYDLCVFIGRFQLMHNGHRFVIQEALTHSEKVLILVGSANQARSHRNPFTFQERKQMILDTFGTDADRLIIKPLEDSPYNDTKWVENVQKAVVGVVNDTYKRPKASVALIGHSKDASSYYLKLFPQWDSINVLNYENFSATPMRTAYFSNIGHLWVVNADGHRDGDKPVEKLVPTPVKEFLEKFIKTEEYKYILDEYEFVQNYKRQWNITLPDGKQFPPYPIIFVCVDACVIKSGHVLMVTRKASPGKGMLALPGGYVEVNERLEDAMIRELKKETKIKVPSAVLRGSITKHEIYDDPDRSSRGRVITTAYLIDLGVGELDKVKGGDDASSAQWIELAKLDPTNIFEDHYAIISHLVGI